MSVRRIVDYPNLGGDLRDLYQQPGIAETVNLDHIKRLYYVTHDDINPTQIVPIGPSLDLAHAGWTRTPCGIGRQGSQAVALSSMGPRVTAVGSSNTENTFTLRSVKIGYNFNAATIGPSR